MGRPLGKDYPERRLVLLTGDDLALLKRLAEETGCSTSAVIRRLLREEGKRKPPSTSESGIK